MNTIILTNEQMPVIHDCNHVITPKDFLHPNRTLNFHVLLYVKKGTFYLTEDGTDYEIPSGSLFFMKAGCNHYGKVPIQKGAEWYFIHFYLPQATYPSIIGPRPALPEFTPSIQPFSCNEILHFKQDLPKQLFHLQGTEAEALLIELVERYHSNDPMRGWELNAQLFSLLSFLAQNLQPSTQLNSLSEQICQYLAAHKEEPFSAAQLEANFYLSYKHLAAVFKKEQQMTMQQYHNLLRMQQAAHLLTSTQHSITEIAQRLGFHDALYFSKCFRSYFKESPSAYRQTHYFLGSVQG